jgi:hypothetical protein
MLRLEIDYFIFIDYNGVMRKITILLLCMILMPVSFAQIKSYRGTSEGELNNDERFNKVEKFLKPIAKKLNSMQKKIDALSADKFTVLSQRIDKLEKAIQTLSQANKAGKGPTGKTDLSDIKANIKTMQDDGIAILFAEVEFLKDGLRDMDKLIRSLHPNTSRP